MAKVTIYTTSYCPYCVAAKRYLSSVKKVDYVEIDVSTDDEKRQALLAKTGQQTVPQIFIGETHVGGYTDLRALDKAGGLDALLSSE